MPCQFLCSCKRGSIILGLLRGKENRAASIARIDFTLFHCRNLQNKNVNAFTTVYLSCSHALSLLPGLNFSLISYKGSRQPERDEKSTK